MAKLEIPHDDPFLFYFQLACGYRDLGDLGPANIDEYESGRQDVTQRSVTKDGVESVSDSGISRLVSP
jgi:hypothetical protein